MKSTAWKKDFLVVLFQDYDNTWRDLTIPCTLKQAARFVSQKNYTNSLNRGTVRVVTLAEFAALNA